MMAFLILNFAFLIFNSPQARAQIISTIAGNGTAGYTGDGGQATAAELYIPQGVAVDASGNLYIADYFNNVIRTVSTSGIISTFAGTGTGGYTGDGGQATAATLNAPTGVAFDASGNLYISEYTNNRIRKVNAAGIISTFAGTGTAGYTGDGGQATAAELNYPYGAAVDASGNVYIADVSNSVIRKVSTAGIISTFAGTGTGGYSGDGGQATAATLNQPYGVATDASGNVYIADQGNQRIRKVSTAGIISTFAGTGTAAYSGDGGQATAATLNAPRGIATDASGNVYIADYSNNVIRKVSAVGIISTCAGNGTAAYSGDGGQATAAGLNNPYGVATDASGNLYISDQANQRIRKVNTAGIISTYAGSGPATYTGDGGQATAATLNAPFGVAFDASGNLYIADYSNQRIRTVNTAGIISTFAGNGTAAYSGDGGQATAAELYQPAGVAFDAAGNLYIADANNNRIRKVCVSACAGAGIEQFSIENDEVRIWPNPSNSVINVELGVMSETTKVEVLNTLGEVVIHNSSLITHNLVLDVSGLPAGVYFVRLGTATQKFIKQ